MLLALRSPSRGLQPNGSRLTAAAPPWRSTLTGRQVPSHACSMPHYRFSPINAADRRRRGGAGCLCTQARSRMRLQARPHLSSTSLARTMNVNSMERTDSRSSAFHIDVLLVHVVELPQVFHNLVLHMALGLHELILLLVLPRNLLDRGGAIQELFQVPR